MFVNAVGNIFPPLAVLLMSPILAQQLGVAGRGELAAATAPYLLAVAIASLGLPDAIVQSVASGLRLGRASWLSVSALTIVSGLIASAVIALAAPLLAQGGADIVVSLIVVAGAATLPSLGVALLRGMASGVHAWRLVSAERIANGSIKILGTFALVASGNMTLTSTTVLIAYSPVAAGLVYLVLPAVYKKAPEAVRVRPSATLSYGMKAWLGSSAGILMLRLSQLLVMPLSNSTQLGLYAVAVNVSEVPLIANSAIREVMFSADAAGRDDQKLTQTARISFIVCAATALPILVTMVWWLPFLFGEEFVPAVPSIILSAVAVLVGVPGSIAGSSLAARGHPSLRSLSITFGCIANVALVFALVPLLGAVGASLATLVGNLISSNSCIIYANRRFGMKAVDFYAIRSTDFVALWAVAMKLARRRRP
jgi:O-antigen/teichoic acid export membrane protein